MDRFDLQRLELHRRFVERTAMNVQTLSELTLRFDHNALGPGAREQLRYIAHNLAGAAGTFGFPVVSATAADLEDRLLSPGRHDIGQSCRALITQLKQVTSSMPAAPLRRQGDLQKRPIATADSRALPEVVPNGVLIVARSPELDRLSSIVAGLGYTPIDVLTSKLEGPASIAAALVSDTVPEALQICRRYSPQVPVLLVGSDASFHGRLAAVRMGTTGVLTRPVDASELADWLEELAPRETGRPHFILIVEGDRLLAETYALELESAGMRCEVVTDGAMTLDRIAATNPDLVLLETRLPGINGIELARIIRQSRRDLALPIVFLSSESDPLLQLEARTLGGDDFIEKPVDREGLVALIRLRAHRGAELRSLMERDGLTGLANHGRFMDRLAQELERCRRTKAEVTVAMVDLDHLQRINEQFGHMGGDAVIRVLAQVLVARLRRIDVVGRYDGDQLAVILLDTAPELVGKVLDQIREGFASLPFRMADTAFSATASIGVAGSRDFPQIERLIGAAEAALADAKQAGRNSLRCAHAAATPEGAPVYSGPAMPH
ncbi:MAG: diguanylate cyclase [Devosia sp.]|nr:diguanylate cyclase [Devosia sp.]